jgi:hypothetical protein
MFLTIVLLACAATGWYLLHETDVEYRAATPAKRKSRFRAVRIVPTSNLCAAVRTANQQRFLLSAAPRLPLEQCDRIMRCRCRFKHFADRRSGDDRRQIFGSLTEDTLRGPMNRRAGMERRNR